MAGYMANARKYGVEMADEEERARQAGQEGPITRAEKKEVEDQVTRAMGSPAGAAEQYAEMIKPMSEEQLRIAQQQQQLANALRAQVEGKTPSLAEMQFQRALQQSQAAIQSQLASARGLSPAQAQRLAARQQAALGAAGAGQSAEIRLREQQAAQAALANLLAQSRQGALGGYSTAAELSARERRLRAEIASGIRTRDEARRTAMISGLIGAAPFVGQGLAKAYEAYKTPTGVSSSAGATGDYSQTEPYGKDSPEWWDYQPQAPSSDSTPGEPVFGGDPRTELAHGAEVAGRAKYRGDTRSNDTVPAMLSPGEIVLPRSVAQSPDAPDKAKRFVEAIKSKKKPSPKDYTQALMRLHELESRMDAMESLADMKAEEE